ncbi:hypothetical protein FHL15_010023 [Xylaria flabelliformis]|uniref:Uncharacterized protein n=1 Tax=Xylaria flabelliformis TaxID=2512241 RepID=A0A553HMH0_9PEZI|nr:hypothetical protein FHL15_010023 [Xylaria flabelliformis]
MATHSNSGPANGEIERVGRGAQPDISYSTRAVRDITYKVIPFCSLFLVIFSTGVVITSTFAFDKPVPRQGTIVISSMLLSLFILFSIGFMYLNFRKSWPHKSNYCGLPGFLQQASPSNHNDRSKNKIAPTTIGPDIEMTDHAGPRDSGYRIIPSDVLQDSAPSPKTYRKRTEEHQYAAAQGQNMVYELHGSTPQQVRYPTQRYARQDDKASRPGPSNMARDGGLEEHQLFSGGRHSTYMPASMGSKNYMNQTSSRPDTGEIQKATRQLPPVGDLKRSSAVTGNIYQTVGIQDYRGLPIQQSLPTRKPQYTHRHEISSQGPSISMQAYEPSPISSQASVKTEPRQFPSPLSDTPFWSTAAPRPPAKTGEQSGREYRANDFPWPSGRSDTRNGREIPRPPIQLDGQSGNLPLDTLRKRPMGPRPMNGGLHNPVNTGEGTVNSAISNRGLPNPLRSEQIEPKQSYQSHSDVRCRRKSIPWNIANSLNGVHQDTSNKSSAFTPQTFPSSLQEYSRYPATAPRPLQLPNSDYLAHSSRIRHKKTPQPCPLSHEPPIFEVEEENKEVPKIPIRALGSEKMKTSRSGAQHRTRFPLRGNSRKFKRKNSRYWSRLEYKIKRGNEILNPV